MLPILLVSCGGTISQPPGQARDPNRDVADYVDSEAVLGASDRDEISDFIRSLPAHLRSSNAYYYVADTSIKKMYSNRSFLRDSLAINPQEKYSYMAFEPHYGPVVSSVGTQSGFRPTCTSGQTGAFVADYTKGGNWKRMTTVVQVPTPSQLNDLGSSYMSSVQKRDEETGQLLFDNKGRPIYHTGSEAYIYVGGWGGATGGANSRRAIDAGLKHNVRSTIDPSANDHKRFFSDWDLFIKTQDKFVISVNDDYSNNDARVRFKDGQQITMEFGRSKSPTSSAEYLYAKAAGLDNYYRNVDIIVGIEINHNNKLDSWYSNYNDLTFKRVISIAQTKAVIQDRVGVVPRGTFDMNRDYFKDGSFIREAAFMNTWVYTANGTGYRFRDSSIYEGMCRVSSDVTYTWTPVGTFDMYANVDLSPNTPPRGASIPSPYPVPY